MISRVYYSGFVFAWATVMATVGIAQHRVLGVSIPSFVLWVALLAVVHVLPLKGWKSANLSVDLPVSTAAVLVLSPLAVGLAGFLGAWDWREIARQIHPAKTLFNRCQTATCYSIAAVAVHHLAPAPSASRLIVPLAILAMVTITICNFLFIAIAIAIEYSTPLSQAFRALRLGQPIDYALSFLGSAILGAMLAALYDQSQPWALVAFIVPAVMARQALATSEGYRETRQKYESREQVVQRMAASIHEERSDERRLIASDLHDDVLQPLFKVTLMANVLKADIAQGRLLEMDEDLPELLSATEAASTALRALIGDLRASPIGRKGLSPAIFTLVRGLEKRGDAQLHSEIEDVETEGGRQLVIYQVAKEALANAASHARAANIWITLRRVRGEIQLTVKDDGIGFDLQNSPAGHYGIQIMRERARSVGATLLIDSIPRRGAILTLMCPD